MPTPTPRDREYICHNIKGHASSLPPTSPEGGQEQVPKGAPRQAAAEPLEKTAGGFLSRDKSFRILADHSTVAPMPLGVTSVRYWRLSELVAR
mmetsp:Transcript_5021/g.9814  ORF Transcript_5021/g.9814 Transcript_5021/m.9814 type:complete len:93 (-) Transcript_5021:144-422(-)